MLEDLVTSAANQALTKAREAAAQSMASLAGGLPIPGLSGLFGPGGPGAMTGGGS
jgi:DNA-binding protein YbaB